MDLNDIKFLLDQKHDTYNRISFIDDDPVSVPHLFEHKEDIEITGFLTATISWGRRSTIIENAKLLLKMMDFSPYEFITQAGERDMSVLKEFRHRTFNGLDCVYFIRGLKNIYLNHGGLEEAFGFERNKDIRESIGEFRKLFFSLDHPSRIQKHISDPSAGSPAKRLNMYLRWMVRKDNRGVDFGIWKSALPSQLYCPLDVHTGRVARKLGLITRNQNDWIALEELMARLREFDPDDPVKYDYALFGLGIFENF